jgi:hypothetical protein
MGDLITDSCRERCGDRNIMRPVARQRHYFISRASRNLFGLAQLAAFE